MLPTDYAAFMDRLLSGSLPKVEWTHTAHLLAGACMLHQHPDPQTAMNLIREAIIRHNNAVGTPNTDQEGYHESITQAWMKLIHHHVIQQPGEQLQEKFEHFLSLPLADPNALLHYYSRELLFSVKARRQWCAPDLKPLP